MADNKLTQEMKRHAVIVALQAEHSNLQIAQFLKVAQSFVFKICKELEDNDGDLYKIQFLFNKFLIV